MHAAGLRLSGKAGIYYFLEFLEENDNIKNCE
jgi:hypothetical protein